MKAATFTTISNDPGSKTCIEVAFHFQRHDIYLVIFFLFLFFFLIYIRIYQIYNVLFSFPIITMSVFSNRFGAGWGD